MSKFMAWNFGYKKVMVESDSISVINWLAESGESNFLSETFILACRDWILKPWVFVVQHIFREGNRVADDLAKRAHTLQHGAIQICSNPPKDMTRIILEDAAGRMTTFSKLGIFKPKLLFSLH